MKKASYVIIAICCCTLLIPLGYMALQRNGSEVPLSSAAEMKHKQNILNEDILKTAQLCQGNCQSIIEKVRVEQRKNLRLVPYPSDKRFKLESVDANNLRDVKVNHPEDNQGTSHYHRNQVVVKFKTHPTNAQMKKIQQEINASYFKKLGYSYVFESKTMNAKQLMQFFRKWDTEYIEPHFYYFNNDTSNNVIIPNDSLYSQYQWNLPIIGTDIGWKVSRGTKDVIIAVVDTGADLNHPDLKPNLLPGYNAIDDNAHPYDDVGHGTHVAGIISALVNNSEGIAGISWYNRIMPVKVLDQSGAGSTYEVAGGIIWAADHGAKVINLSLGNYAEAHFLHDAVKYAFDKDVVIVSASGNDNTEQPGYPAAYPEVLAVSATAPNKDRASFSNYGTYIDVAAPGVNIASTYPTNQYAALSGTSMSSPHVAALAGLIRSANPSLKNTEVMDIIRKSAEDLGPRGKDKYFGYGQINVAKALQMADPTQPQHVISAKSNWLERTLFQIAESFKR